MKFTQTEELEIEDPILELRIFLDRGTSTFKLEYTCPSCGGHGCKFINKGECYSGNITLDINPKNLAKSFSGSQVQAIRKIIQDTFGSIMFEKHNVPK